MKIQFKCRCGKMIQVSNRKQGDSITCPICGRKCRIPDSGQGKKRGHPMYKSGFAAFINLIKSKYDDQETMVKWAIVLCIVFNTVIFLLMTVVYIVAPSDGSHGHPSTDLGSDHVSDTDRDEGEMTFGEYAIIHAHGSEERAAILYDLAKKGLVGKEMSTDPAEAEKLTAECSVGE